MVKNFILYLTYLSIISLQFQKEIDTMTKMFSSKLEIINHFDNLIQRVDIDIEECLEKYNEKQVIGDLKLYKSFKKNEKKTKRKRDDENDFESFKLNESSQNKSYENGLDWFKEAKQIEEDLLIKHQINENVECEKIYKTVDLWSEETRVVDYLKQIRMRTIEELREAQKETLDSYKLLRSDDSKSESFPDKFYFQVLYKQSEPEEWIFKLFTFLTDFYMSPDDINLFE